MIEKLIKNNLKYNKIYILYGFSFEYCNNLKNISDIQNLESNNIKIQDIDKIIIVKSKNIIYNESNVENNICILVINSNQDIKYINFVN